MSEPTITEQKPTSATISFGAANAIAAVLAVVTVALFGFGFVAIWDAPLSLSVSWLLPAFILLVPVHEGLHGLGFLAGGARRSEIKFGMNWKQLMPFAHCRKPLSVASYRLAVALPGILLGLLPAVAGLALRNANLVAIGVIGVFTAGGDLAVLWAVRSVREGRLVLDHPSEVGCHILPEPDRHR